MNGARLKIGLYMATQSFSMLWYEKKLLLYFGIPSLISLVLKVLAYNAVAIPLDSPAELLYFTKKLLNSFLTIPEWEKFLAVASIHLANLAFMTFFSATLIHHLGHIMQGEKTGFKENLEKMYAKLWPIISWTLIFLIVELIILRASESSSFLLLLLTAFATIAVFLYAFFALVLIVFKDKPLLILIAQSGSITKEFLQEILGGTFWFGLVFLMISAPAYILWWVLAPTMLQNFMILHPMKYQIFMFIGIFTTEIILRCVISTAFIIFKVMLYQLWRQKHASQPEEQRYPSSLAG